LVIIIHLITKCFIPQFHQVDNFKSDIIIIETTFDLHWVIIIMIYLLFLPSRQGHYYFIARSIFTYFPILLHFCFPNFLVTKMIIFRLFLFPYTYFVLLILYHLRQIQHLINYRMDQNFNFHHLYLNSFDQEITTHRTSYEFDYCFFMCQHLLIMPASFQTMLAKFFKLLPF
jgi:hypothetical protein